MVDKSVSLRIDGQLTTVPEGQTVLEAARALGRPIPTLCYLKGVCSVGSCRMCMVEQAGASRLVPACTTPVQEGMSIVTQSPRLAEYRRMNVELLLVERMHICSVCVSDGHCELQQLSRDFGVTHVRYAYHHARLPVDMSHPRFVLDHNRCILCTRCVRVCNEVEGAQVWEVSSRGVHSRIVCDLKDDWGKAQNCTNCGKCVQACPTGALAEKTTSVHQNAKQSEIIAHLVEQRSKQAATRHI